MNPVSIGPHTARVPNLLASQIALASITGSSRDLLDVQVQMASGRVVNRPSDDAIAATSIAVLDDAMERREQHLRNLSAAEGTLGVLDGALGEATDLLQEARSIGLGQIGVGSDAATRRSQAEVVDAMLQGLIDIANRDHLGVHLFGGGRTAVAPFDDLLGGVAYGGDRGAFTTDLGTRPSIPLTLSGGAAFGAVSARVEGTVDLDPELMPDTPLEDLRGARGLGVATGPVVVNVDGTETTVDLSDAYTVQDVIDALEAAIQATDAGATVTIDPGGDALRIATAAATTITVADQDAAGAAADLGLAGVTFNSPAGVAGDDVDPRLTMDHAVGSLTGLGGPLGTIRISNLGQIREIDLSGATSIEDVANEIAAANVGVTLEITGDDRLNLVSTVSGGPLSVEEVSGGSTATMLGIRSLQTDTPLSVFNRGRGVDVVSGSVDPTTGLPSPALDMDFRIETRGGAAFEVDLAGATTAGNVISTINAAASAAGLTVPADFQAALATDGNGIVLNDATAATGTIRVLQLNNSGAAADLGLLGSTDGAVHAGEDRATVFVESAFTHLVDLRDALRNDDEFGISFATDSLQNDIDRAAEARGLTGVRARRVLEATIREEDRQVQDESLRSQLRDLDYAEASIRFTSLQQQLEAAMATTSRLSGLSLLDYLR